MNRPRSRPLPRLLLVLAAVAVTTLGLMGPAAAAAPYCGLTWGSLPEEATGHEGPGSSTVSNVGAGQHACFDRLVVDLAGVARAGYDVRYVPELRADGSGALIPLRGGAVLQVVVRAPAYDDNGNATYQPADPQEVVGTAGFRTFRQVAWAGSFEGNTTLGIGPRARLPFRVFTLDGPERIVIDVAHRW
ncbi:MAG: hypothetical protein JWR28_585 [Modestobacter sp.]|nr:hypothetical protein [Modestobacter sp.]MCW2617436.1 hypothetical protein [Modestobacter sp.]